MDNMEEICEMRWKLWKKIQLNSEMIWKIWKLKSEMILKMWKKILKRYGKYGRKLWNVKWYGKYGRKASRIGIRCEQYGRKLWKIWKIWKKIVKYEMIRKIWKKGDMNSDKLWQIWKKIVKTYDKYGRKPSWIVKRFVKYRRKVGWIVKWYGKYGRQLWNDMKNMGNIEEQFFFTKQLILHASYLRLHYALQ